MAKLVEVVDGRPRFRSIPPLVTPLRDLVDPAEAEQTKELILRGFADYRKSLLPERRVLLDRFHLVDLARKVVGVGSVGTRCLIALLVGRDANDALLLQFKEAGSSVLEPYAGKSIHRHHGARVVNGQRLIQVASDVFLGWNTVDGRGEHYYWRQLRDMKASAEIGALGGEGTASVRRGVRLVSGTRARPLRRSSPHRRVPWQARPRSTRPWPASPSGTPTRRSRIGKH